MSPRRRLFTFLVLLLLPLLTWFLFEQDKFAARRAAAPVIRASDDGKVYVNDRELVIGHDGLPPKALEEMEGAPPVEVTDPKLLPADLTQIGNLERRWHYPRTGLLLIIGRQVKPPTVSYWGMLWFDAAHPCTLAMRGQRWWLGPSGPLGSVSPWQFRGEARSRSDESKDQVVKGDLTIRLTDPIWQTYVYFVPRGVLGRLCFERGILNMAHVMRDPAKPAASSLTPGTSVTLDQVW